METVVHFEVDEILLLEHLTYLSDISPFHSILRYNGKTVEELLDTIPLSGIDDYRDYSTYLLGEDWINVILALRRNRDLLKVRIPAVNLDRAPGGGGGISAVMISEERREAVVAFRGTAPDEWADDFAGGGVIETPQQRNALNWYRRVYAELQLGKYFVTVTGHSKGGNKAKFITLMDETPDRCISFDGQGFSDLFIRANRDKILERRSKIQNHNVDYDYVNLILNDVGSRTYYYGYSYGKGGLAESHCPNTFFDFDSSGYYKMHRNPNGQSVEMKMLDRFLNTLIRTLESPEEVANETELVGNLVEQAFKIRSNGDTKAFLNYLFEMIASPVYNDNAAYLFAFCIQYEKHHPGFLASIRDVLSHFKMENVTGYVSMAERIINWNGLPGLIGMAGKLSGQVPKFMRKQISTRIEKKFGIILTDEEMRNILQILTITSRMLKTMKIRDEGTDLNAELLT